jgi:hypothetical protein
MKSFEHVRSCALLHNKGNSVLLLFILSLFRFIQLVIDIRHDCRLLIVDELFNVGG